MTEDVKAQQYTAYRWVVLFIFAFIAFFVSFCQFQPAYFAQDIMRDFGISSQGFAQLTSFPMAAGIILSLVAGTATDKFGIKWPTFIGLIISVAAMIFRCFCADYAALLFDSIFLGIASTFVVPNVAKMAMTWFPHKQVSLAVGIGMAMGTAGIAVSQMFTGVFFSNYHTAFFVGAIIMVIMMAAWLVFGRDKKQVVSKTGAIEEKVSVKEGLKTCFKSKDTILAGMGLFFFQGFNVTISSFLITALVVVWGTDAVTAGIIAGLLTIGSTIGSIILPPQITRSKNSKLICIALPVITIALMAAGWFINADAARLICFTLAGVAFGGVLPSFMLFPSLLPEIDANTAGTAGGLMASLMMLGSVVLPSFVITPIAGSNYGLAIALGCASAIICSVLFVILPSVHTNTAEATDAEAVNVAAASAPAE